MCFKTKQKTCLLAKGHFLINYNNMTFLDQNIDMGNIFGKKC